MNIIYTIGYEGASVADLVATLQHAGVKTLFDIRELPQSRRQGFSKNALAAHLAEAGIEYSHHKQLGDPKPGRIAAREGRMAEFREIFGKHLQLEATKRELETVANFAQEAPAVLLCFERDPQHCHRSLVAKAISELCSLSVRHLGVVEHGAKRGAAGFPKAA